METKTASFTIGEVKGPDGTQVKVDAKVEFEYEEYASLDEAKWSDKDLLALVNSQTKANARAAKYQMELKLRGLVPDPNDILVIRANLIRTYTKANIPEEIAVAQVDSLLAAQLAARAEKLAAAKS
jgi:hypothetical protein